MTKFSSFTGNEESRYAPDKHTMSVLSIVRYAFKKLCAVILFMFQWNIAKFWKESSFGPEVMSLLLFFLYDTTKSAGMLL